MTKQILFFSFSALTIFSAGIILGQENLAQKLAGRIVLEVESHGEAWYVDPVNLNRYYLGRPSDCFEVMRTTGLGISTDDIAQISIAEKSLTPPKILQNNPINSNTQSQSNQAQENLTQNNPIQSSSQQILIAAGEAIRAGSAKTTEKYFTDGLSSAIQYTLKNYTADQRLTLGNIISGASLKQTTSQTATYSTQVSSPLGGNTDIQIRLAQNERGEWKIEYIGR